MTPTNLLSANLSFLPNLPNLTSHSRLSRVAADNYATKAPLNLVPEDTTAKITLNLNSGARRTEEGNDHKFHRGGSQNLSQKLSPSQPGLQKGVLMLEVGWYANK